MAARDARSTERVAIRDVLDVKLTDEKVACHWLHTFAVSAFPGLQDPGVACTYLTLLP